MVRLIGYFFGIGTILLLIVAGGITLFVSNISKDLPDYEVLAKYDPPVMTRVHASDGSLMAEFARQRRLFLPIQAVPDRVKAAFVSAEDKSFYQHHGLDYLGLARAMSTNITNKLMGSTRRPVGASTITQQVAKNMLLSSEQTYDRKIKEAIVALRMEQAYSKDRILELYLNEMFFGMSAYGIAGAALTYFDKSVNELTISESAYLAALLKGPANYHPFRYTERAIERRNWVIDRMQENGYISVEDATEAKATPLGVKPHNADGQLFASEYFTEEVRRQIISRYGVDALYDGGLSVRATLDPKLQRTARSTLQSGFIKYDQARGYRGPVKNITIGSDWGKDLGAIDRLSDVPEWQMAVVLDVTPDAADIGLQPDRDPSGKISDVRITGKIAASDMKWALRMDVGGKRSTAKSPAGVFEVGDVIYVQKKAEGSGYNLRQIPKISGAMVAMDPHTGRVLAMIGGFSYAQSEFNRATQAYRQPGSSFKPFVYAAALDNGYTPASVVLDGPISVDQGGALGVWSPKNYSGKFAGPSTLRYGIEQSRNLMTVRLAQDMGMKTVAEYAERFGIYDKMLPVLSMSLGAGETTVLRMVTGYSIMANGGRAVTPSMIDRVQDRYGKTIFKHDMRECQGCNATEWNGQDEPELIDDRDQVLDPMTAYQITSMMEGVVQRGTAAMLKSLDRPIAGKTGTTNEEKDAWFVGFTPDMVVGVYLGMDQPAPLGRGSTGSGLAAPVFKDFMAAALKGKPKVDFRVPEGMTMVSINRRTGMRSEGSGPDVIMEAFKPGTGPADSYSVIGADSFREGSPVAPQSPQANRAINSGSGGLY